MQFVGGTAIIVSIIKRFGGFFCVKPKLCHYLPHFRKKKQKAYSNDLKLSILTNQKFAEYQIASHVYRI